MLSGKVSGHRKCLGKLEGHSENNYFILKGGAGSGGPHTLVRPTAVTGARF